MGSTCHHHNHSSKLGWAAFINILLTLAQLIGGVISGSLSLIADAIHNLGDAGAIFIAMLAQKIGNKPANQQMTYGYKRAEIIGALLNSSTLIFVGFYLLYEATKKLLNPTEIDGQIVLIVATIAFLIDLITAILTYKAGAKDSMNIRAAFIHNVSDALASIAVILSGLAIIYLKWYFIDVIATALISLYVIYHGYGLAKKSLLILMQAFPEHLNRERIVNELESLPGITKAEHLHAWQLDDEKVYLEGQLLITSNCNPNELLPKVKKILKERHHIHHSTIELSKDPVACYPI